MVHLPVALFRHDHIVCVCHAPAHRILVYYVGAVARFWHIAGGAGVVVVDVVSTAGAITVVSITMIWILLGLTKARSSAASKVCV